MIKRFCCQQLAADMPLRMIRYASTRRPLMRTRGFSESTTAVDTIEADSTNENWRLLSPASRQLAQDLLLSHDNNHSLFSENTTSSNDMTLWKKRLALSKAITLVESSTESKRVQASHLLEYLVNQRPRVCWSPRIRQEHTD
jgi:hypothetical protein